MYWIAIKCDGCGQDEMVPHTMRVMPYQSDGKLALARNYVHTLRAMLKADGWRQDGRFDYCPRCSEVADD